MKLTKYTHACVRLEDGDRSLVIDPGVFSELGQALDGVDGVLITHEHPDHVDVEQVLAAAARNEELGVWAPASLQGAFAELGDRFTVTGPGQSFQVAGFGVESFGGQHALIHSSVPVIPNVAYLVDKNVYHPGDSFTVPTMPVKTLLVPIHAPWSKISEVLDFVIATRAGEAHQIHDGLLNSTGLGFVNTHVNRVAGEYGTRYAYLDSGTEITV